MIQRCAVCGIEISEEDLEKGRAYKFKGIIKCVDCKENLSLKLKCPIHGISLEDLYYSSRGNVYRCPQCNKAGLSGNWWLIRKIKPWYIPNSQQEKG